MFVKVLSSLNHANSIIRPQYFAKKREAIYKEKQKEERKQAELVFRSKSSKKSTDKKRVEPSASKAKVTSRSQEVIGTEAVNESRKNNRVTGPSSTDILEIYAGVGKGYYDSFLERYVQPRKYLETMDSCKSPVEWGRGETEDVLSGYRRQKEGYYNGLGICNINMMQSRLAANNATSTKSACPHLGIKTDIELALRNGRAMIRKLEKRSNSRMTLHNKY